METVDALGTRRAHTAQRSSQLPSTGRSGPARPGSAIELLSSADPRTEAEPERSSGDLSSPAFFQSTLLAARRGGTASTAVGLGCDSAGSWSPELDAQRSAPRGQDLPRALPAADPTLHAYTQCPRSVSAPLRPLELSVNGARSSPFPSSEEGARESVRRPGGSGRGSWSRSA